MGIDDDAQQWAAAFLTGAVSHAAIVRQHRADAGENRVRVMPQGLHVGTRLFAGDPSLNVARRLPRGIILRRGDFSVKSQRGLQRHQRAAGPHEMDEGFVQRPGARRISRRHLDLDTLGAELVETAAAHLRIRILRRTDHLVDSRRDDRIGAGRRASLKGMRLERDIHGRASRTLARFFER